MIANRLMIVCCLSLLAQQQTLCSQQLVTAPALSAPFLENEEERPLLSSNFGSSTLKERALSAFNAGDVSAIQNLVHEGFDINSNVLSENDLVSFNCIDRKIICGQHPSSEKKNYCECYSEANLLMLAGAQAKISIMQALLEFGADPNATFPRAQSMTPLMMLLTEVPQKDSKNVAEGIRYLVEAQADLESRSKSDLTPFAMAAFHNKDYAVRELVERGANMNALYDDMTVLSALRTGSGPIKVGHDYRVLIEQLANMGAKDSDMRSCCTCLIVTGRFLGFVLAISWLIPLLAHGGN